jgi:16S rRNA A1518/A1519 N6-dimethyltransferase RsmA/KsgA/DIM1 with predicted DNA glycosylase/AP lyase activity
MLKKKSLGQNFLNSPKIVSDIVSAGKVSEEDVVLSREHFLLVVL